MTDKLLIRVKKLKEEAKLPTKAYQHDAGWDLYYCSQDKKFDEVKIYPGKRFLFGTGIALEIPIGYYGQIVPRSGLAWKNGADVMAGICDCFSEQMKITTPDGEKTIHDLNIGDQIVSLNLENSELEMDTITDIINKGQLEILVIEFEDGSVLEITPDTEILKDNEFTLASNLQKGDFINKF